jgi:outer membrane protein assembly factor BamA
MTRGALFGAAFALAISVVASAEDPAAKPLIAQELVAPSPAPAASPSPTDAAPSPAPGPLEPTKDLIDVLRDLLHKPEPPPPDFKKRMVAASPVLGYSPTTGVSVGGAGNVAFYRGSPPGTRISSIVTSATATSKSQFLVSFKMSASSFENRWRIDADNRFFWTSQPTYGLGTDTTQADKLDMKFNHLRLFDKYYHQVHRNVFLGVGYVYNIHNNVRPPDEVAPELFADSPYIAYSEKFGFDLDSQTSAGFSFHALVDSRDGAINPSRGWYASTSYLVLIEDFLGGSSSWQQFSYDFRSYAMLSRDGRHKLAFWTFGDLVTGGVAPYLDLPSTGGDTYARSGRGYPQGRFRGEKMLYGEAEYRWTVTRNGLFGMVAFLNTETLSNEQANEKLFDSFATGAGIGFRFMLNKRSKTNLCFDIGFGRESTRAVYFGVQEAF